jgi:hypothetical protein
MEQPEATVRAIMNESREMALGELIEAFDLSAAWRVPAVTREPTTAGDPKGGH